MMNVTCAGSCSRLRISFAARPTATRSRERSSSTASSSEMRSPETARSRISETRVPSATLISGPPESAQHFLGLSCDGGPGRLDEAQLRHRLEQARVARELEEGVETGALARPEAVAELLEVACEEAGRIAVAIGRL